MGRRKIEIKAIKDDRNRSVTFLKRKGGLFKKAHELSVLCSVDVAVFIFGSNKKLYEYSSSDMRDLITRYSYFGQPNEHKGPSDFNGGANDDDDDDDENGTPPQADHMDPHMLPPHFQGQPPFPHLRGHTPSASPPIGNGVPFQPHPGHPRGHTPQPQMGSRPGSRNDIRRMGPNMVPGPVGPPPPQPSVNGYAYVPQPAIYNPQNPSNMPPSMPHGLPPQGPQQYQPYPPPPPQQQQQQQQQQHQQQQQQQQQQPPSQPPMLPYIDDQRRSLPPTYPPPGQQPPISRPEPSPQIQAQQLPQPPLPHMSPPPPQPPQLEPQPPPQPQPQEPAPPATMEPKREPAQERPKAPLLNTDAAIKKLPARKQHSIFTPIDEGRSILSQHLAFHEPKDVDRSKSDPSRSHSVDVGSVSRSNGHTTSPPLPQRANTQSLTKPRVSSIPETTFTPPSRTNSLKIGGGGGASRPRLKVQIPGDGGSENGSATADSNSPQPGGSFAGPRPVLPPPSPSASALLSAGATATGPPNPFAARPPPNQSNSMNVDTPVSALPSRFLNTEFLPSPSTFYPDWDFRSNNSNTLPSPLNFATPIAGTGPSFLRDEGASGANKRKTPEPPPTSNAAAEASDGGPDAKRVKHEA